MNDLSVEEFKETIRSYGMSPPNNLELGKLHRFPGIGKNQPDTTGWARLFEDGLGGMFGDWRSGFTETWQSSHKTTHHSNSLMANTQYLQRQAEQVTKHARASQEVTLMLSTAEIASPNYPYLVDKNIGQHGIYEIDDKLVVPLYDISQDITSAQYIKADGSKKFHPGGRTKACFYPMGFDSAERVSTLVIAEGFATAATIFEATDLPTVVAFNCGNLSAVAKVFRDQYPNIPIIIAADDDHKTVGNPGIAEARKAAQAINGLMAIPQFGEDRQDNATDFNDMAADNGSDAVKDVFQRTMDQSVNVVSVSAGTHLENTQTWSKPEIPSHKVPPVLPLPIHSLPEVLRQRVMDVADRLQAPPDFVANPLICMLSSVIGSGCQIRPKQKDDWSVTPNLWGMSIAPPSELKSPSLNEATKHLSLLEKVAHDEFEAEHKEFKSALLAYELELDAAKKNLKKELGKSYGSDKAALEEQAKISLEKVTDSEPVTPIMKRYRTNDTTIEKICELLSTNERGIFVVVDELIGLLQSMDKQGHESAKAIYLQSWNGSDSYTVDRIGRGTTFVEHLCIAIYGGIQPSRLMEYFKGVL